jgi:subtilisin family serine protease
MLAGDTGRNRIVQTVFVTLVLFGMASGLTAAPPGADAKIDPGLITTLINSDDGTGPFFVAFAERTPLGAASRIQDWAARGRFVVDSLQTTANRSQNGVRGYLQGHKIDYTPFWVENKIYVPKGTLELARELAQRPEVAAILPEVIYSIPTPQASGTGVQSVGWNISQIGADQVWSTYSNKGAGIVVATIDSGVQYNHPALVNQYRGNLGGGSFNHTGNWYDPTHTCGSAPCDNVWHGTHTMGTMVGDDGAGNQIGVAPGAKWIACKGCSTTSCSSSALTSCAQWILAPAGNSNLRPNIVNNSWGGGGGDSWYQSFVQNWVAAGVFPAFSIGNSGPNCSTAGSPGDYSASFASGATDSLDNIAGFSSRGPSAFGGVKPDVSAPGVNIYSSVPTNAYGYASGTSMASPHTAGTVALLWATRPSYNGNIPATQSLVENNTLIRTTTETCGGLPAGASPNNTYGSGRINAKETVDAGAGAVSQPPVVTIAKPATDGQQFNCGTSVGFDATASDSQDGNLTGSIQWSGPGTPASGNGGSISKTFSCTTELGNQTVTAQVTDSGGLSATDSVIVNIVNPNGVPAAPYNLAATVSGSNVKLTWTDNAANESGFKVYRRQQTGKKWSSWSVRATLAIPNTNSYTDSISNSAYQYYVTAYNSTGESAPSNSVTVRK